MKFGKNILKVIKKSSSTAAKAVSFVIKEKGLAPLQSTISVTVEHIEEVVHRGKGVVSIKYSDDGGNTWITHCDKKTNMLVHNSRQILTHLLAEGDSDYVLTYFQAGTKGHDTDILIPVPPSITDEKLRSGAAAPDSGTTVDGYVFSKELGAGYTYDSAIPPIDTAIRYIITLESGEANGGGVEAFTEAGLFSSNSKLFSRVTFPAIVKTTGRVIVFEWILIF